MKKSLHIPCCMLSVPDRFSALLSLIFLLFFALLPGWTAAQALEGADLKQFAGTYQLLGNQDLSLEISPSGQGLVLKESWTKREIKFDQKAGLNFVGTADPNFTLDFGRNKKGAISQVTAFKEDVWLKAQPENTKLSAAEAARRAQAYKPIFTAFAAAINANTAQKIQEFLRAYADPAMIGAIPGQQVIRQVQNVYRSTGGIDLYTQKPLQLETGTAFFKGRSLGSLHQVRFSLNAEGKIRNYSYQDLREFAPAQNLVNEAAFQQTIEKALQDLARKDLFSGTVLVAKGNNILVRFAAGETDKKTHAKNTLDTRFNLGSMNKMFTATSILQLAEKGKLRLEDPIGKYLDTTWLPRPLSEKVTVHQLLSHTSGIGDSFFGFFQKLPRTQFQQLEGYKPFTRKLTLVEVPGTKWSYNNTGMLLAGAIVQQVSGMNYFDYVRQNIFQPAGMVNTGVFEIDDKPEKVAIGYIPQADGSFQDNINTPFTLGSPAGGGYSTVEDLYKFALALNAGKLVSEASRTKMFTDYKGQQYGYGFDVRKTPAGIVVGHGGGAPGVNAMVKIFTESGYVLAVLANYDRSAQLVGNYLLSRIQTLPNNGTGK